MSTKKLTHVLLADDDEDDRFFFAKALKKITIPTDFTCVEDGEKLIEYLTKNVDKLPDILFLDINMPCKNGFECLTEIKANDQLKQLIVVMYSTSLQDSMADVLYQTGAHYYFRKGDFSDLVKYLQLVLTMLEVKDFERPLREDFVVNLVEV